MKDAAELELNMDIDDSQQFTDFNTDFYMSVDQSSARNSFLTNTTTAEIGDDATFEQ